MTPPNVTEESYTPGLWIAALKTLDSITKTLHFYCDCDNRLLWLQTGAEFYAAAIDTLQPARQNVPSTFGRVAQAKGAVCSVQPWISALCRHGTWFTQPEICTVCQDACGSYLQNREGSECGEVRRNDGRHMRAGEYRQCRKRNTADTWLVLGSLLIVLHLRHQLNR